MNKLIGQINYSTRGRDGKQGPPGTVESMTWGNILQKPFESVGEHLTVSDGALNVDIPEDIATQY